MALHFPPVRTFIGFPYVPAGIALAAGTSFDSVRYPLSNLMDGYGRTMWRSLYTTAAIQIDLGQPLPVNFIGLLGHNLSHNLLVQIYGSVNSASLAPPNYPLDDELETEWDTQQVFGRAVGVRYPNLWCDGRDVNGLPTTARFWQIHITDNGAPVALGEIVIGLADEYEGIIRSPYREQLYSWQVRKKLVYGQQIVSGSNVVSRSVELDLGITPEDRVILDAVYGTAAEGPSDGQRVVVVPDSRRNDLWFIEWPARREITYPGASYRVGEQTVTLVEETFGATPSAPPVVIA